MYDIDLLKPQSIEFVFVNVERWMILVPRVYLPTVGTNTMR